jgi:MFS transporter, DHA1 family, multidrug resistance protein
VVMGLTGLFLDGTARPMLAGIAGSGVMALLLTRLTLSKRREVVEVSRG